MDVYANDRSAARETDFCARILCHKGTLRVKRRDGVQGHATTTRDRHDTTGRLRTNGVSDSDDGPNAETQTHRDNNGSPLSGSENLSLIIHG